MVARLVEGVAPEGERARRIADALHVEARDLLLEAARAEQHVVGRNATIVEMQLAPFLAAHEARRLTDTKPRRVTRHDHRADPADAGPEPRIDEKHGGVRAEGGEHIGAVDG